MAKRQTKSAVIFIHIPKTAGTTLTEILERQYPPSKRYSLGAKVEKAIIEFKSLDESARADVDALYGHMAYGLHTYLPRPALYVTMLREPVERVISFYYFVRGNKYHYLYDLSQYKAADIKAFVESGHTIMVDNFQVRLLSGVWSEVPFGGVTAEHLAMAKQNLDDFDLVGLTERFDESLLLIKDLLGWQCVWYEARNVTQKRPKKSELSADMLETVRAYNQWDIALYHYAEEVLATQISQQGSFFTWRVKLFRWLNGLFSNYGRGQVPLLLCLRNLLRRLRDRLGYES